jgi:hypothetical protein
MLVVAALGAWGADELLRAERAESVRRSHFLPPFEGQRAPDFTLPDARTGRPVSLATLRNGKPTILMFGSFSCTLFCDQLKEIARFQQKYKNRVEFVFVYVREAGHRNPKLDRVLRNVPLEDTPRRVRAGLTAYRIGLTCLLDGAAELVQREYVAYPERLFILDRQGVVIWESGPGASLSGLHLKEAESQLRNYLDKAAL